MPASPRMNIDRRHFLALTGLAAVPCAGPARAATASRPAVDLGLDATHFGLRPGNPDDQSRLFQRAIEETARMRVPLAVPPGIYRVGNIKLPPGSQLVGTRGATRLR